MKFPAIVIMTISSLLFVSGRNLGLDDTTAPIIIDFSPLPVCSDGDLTIEIECSGKKVVRGDWRGTLDRDDQAQIVEIGFKLDGIKSDLGGKGEIKRELNVYGLEKNGKFYRVKNIKISSKSLKKSEIPVIKGLLKA